MQRENLVSRRYITPRAEETWKMSDSCYLWERMSTRRMTFFGTPICIAALKGHADVVKILMSHKAKLVSGNDVMGSAIHCACFGGDISIVKSMLDRGPWMDYKVGLSIRKLRELAKRWDTTAPYQVLKSISRRQPLDRPAIACSPILLLAERCHFELLELCWTGYKKQPSCSPDDIWHALESHQPSDDNATSTTSSGWSFLEFSRPARTPQNRTLLMWAAASLHSDLINHLLLAGADVEAQDVNGWSALHYAAWPFHDAMFESIGVCVQRLVKAGANVNKSNVPNQTPLMLTISREHPALDPRTTYKWDSDPRERFVRAFLGCGGLVDMARQISNSLLLKAIHAECPLEMIELICKHGAALDLIDTDGFTLLSLVLLDCGDEAVVSILLKHGADPNAINAQPGPPPTPLLMAINNRRPSTFVSALLAYGANPNLGTHLGLTASALAKRRGRYDILRLLGDANAASTTTTHPWFQRVSELPSSLFRSYEKPT